MLGSVSDHYRAPGWFTRNVFNRLVASLTGRGISVLGSRVLAAPKALWAAVLACRLARL